MLICFVGNINAQVFIGVNSGLSLEATSAQAGGAGFNLGADFGFINTSHGTWGISANECLTLGTSSHTSTDLGVFHVADGWDNSSAFIWGAGLDIRSAVKSTYGRSITDDGISRVETGYRDSMGYGLMLRAGATFKWHFYLTGIVTVGRIITDKDEYSMTHTASGIHYNGYTTSSSNNIYCTVGATLGWRF